VFEGRVREELKQGYLKGRVRVEGGSKRVKGCKKRRGEGKEGRVKKEK
jgi:hypothetical protein